MLSLLQIPEVSGFVVGTCFGWLTMLLVFAIRSVIIG